MRILYFSRDYSTHDHRFLSALAKTDHQVYYMRLEKRGHILEERSLPPEIQEILWRGGQRSARMVDAPALLSGLKKTIGEIRPDVIQAGPLQRTAFLAALSGLKRDEGPRLVSMSWGYDLIVDAHRNALWSWATRYTLQHSAVMIGDCETIRRLAISYGMPDERIVTFPWGIDLEFFRPRPEIDDGHHPTFTLLSTRSWEPIYGVDVIARAFVSAAQKLPELRLVMLGNGSEAKLLRQIFADGGVLDKVQFPGQVDQETLRDHYQQADCYVSASHSDGTSISLLEAMACATPVLVSDIPGNREWVQPGAQGWLFRDCDPDALSEAILQAYQLRRQFPQMGEAARKLADERANWTTNFQGMLSAYELALGPSHTGVYNSPGFLNL